MTSLPTTPVGRPKKIIKKNHPTTSSTNDIKPLIDIDQLARDKVDEVENSIDSNNNLTLDSINSWLSILKQIITAADLHRSNDNKNDLKFDKQFSRTSNHQENNNPSNNNNNNSHQNNQQNTGESIYADYADDNEQFTNVDISEQFATNSVKWTIRVRAFKLVHKIVQLFTKTQNHTQFNRTQVLIRHLPDLVRLSFVAATSPYDDLKLQGFEMFKVVINMFAKVEEKEFPGHSILEQYKTQVLSAIKPAFDVDAPPYITAIASQVCCSWLCLGLEKSNLDLKRTFQLMTATIDKLENQSLNQNSKLYTESELEQERLDILGSWAQMYIMSKRMESDVNYLQLDQIFKETNNQISALKELVLPQIPTLLDKWWEALKDYALLIMPTSRIISMSHDNEQVYTREVALRLFRTIWPKLVLASTIWLCNEDKTELTEINCTHSIQDNHTGIEPNQSNFETSQDCNKYVTNRNKYFMFICGIIMNEFCKFTSEIIQVTDGSRSQKKALPETTIYAIRSLCILVNNHNFRTLLKTILPIAQEFQTILYRILIYNSTTKSQLNQMLKIILDQIFLMGFNEINIKTNYVTFSAAKLIVLTNENIKSLEQIIAANSNDYEQQKLKLYLVFNNLSTILKEDSASVIQNDDVRCALSKTFKRILSFESDLSISVSYLNLMRDLCKSIPEELSKSMVSELFGVKLMVTKNLYDKIKLKNSPDKDQLYLEAYSKFLELDINSSESETRTDFLKSYLVLLIDQLSHYQLTTAGRDVKLTESKEFDTIMRRLDRLKSSYAKDFTNSIPKEMQDKYKSAINSRENKIKSKDEERKIAQNPKKPLVTSRPGVGGSKGAKIVLKADFSNFYTKKP